MKLKDVLECGYYDEDTGKDYIVEVNEKKLKEYFKQENIDLVDFNTNMEKKLAVYNLLEEEFTKELNHYKNFTVQFR